MATDQPWLFSGHWRYESFHDLGFLADGDRDHDDDRDRDDAHDHDHDDGDHDDAVMAMMVAMLIAMM